MINKVDLAPMVGADLEVMRRDAAVQRGERPTVFTDLRAPEGARAVAAWVRAALPRAVR
ncbi:MAG: hypothetical protein WD250_15835 [Egibacteraceae bacterium]